MKHGDLIGVSSIDDCAPPPPPPPVEEFINLCVVGSLNVPLLGNFSTPIEYEVNSGTFISPAGPGFIEITGEVTLSPAGLYMMNNDIIVNINSYLLTGTSNDFLDSATESFVEFSLSGSETTSGSIHFTTDFNQCQSPF